MRIVCPACSAAYDVPPDRVPPGRVVRCARCGDNWTPVALVDAEPEIVAAPEPPPRTLRVPEMSEPDVVDEPLERVAAVEPGEPPRVVPPHPLVVGPRREPAPSKAELGEAELGETEPDGPAVVAAPRRGGPKVAVAWVVSLLILAGVGWLAVTQRAAVMKAWPPSERVYAALGLGR